MKYYIVNFEGKGYFLDYYEKYTDEYFLAKKYKTLGAALTRAKVDKTGRRVFKILEKIESEIPFMEGVRIEVIKIDNKRKQKLDKISGKMVEAMKNVGDVSFNEYFKYFKKQSYKYNFYDKNDREETKTATQEDIDDFLNNLK